MAILGLSTLVAYNVNLSKLEKGLENIAVMNITIAIGLGALSLNI